MKANLLSFLLLVTFLGFSQATDIEQFQSAAASMYAIVESTPAIDQSTSGANVTWTYNTLSKTGDSSDANTVPTAGETATYPGTTLVTTTTVVGGADNKMFLKDVSNIVSFTGLLAEGLELNYNSDNALIGDFPLSYTETNGVDTVSGSFNFDNGASTGTFTGTITAEVDAYGTLNTNDVGSGAYSGQVTRLKIVQNLNLNAVTPLTIMTTATQTSYYYYDANNANLVFRTSRVELPLLSLDETVMESLLSSTLSNDNPEISLSIGISPNPVNETLNFDLASDIAVKSIMVSDVTGRTVLRVKTANRSLAVSQFRSGIYIATVETNKGIFSRKFIKR